MLKKLYERSQLVFALAWIIAYVVLASTGDQVSEALGISKIVTLPILMAMSGVLYFFVSKNGLAVKYGLCSPELPAGKLLYYIPLFVLLTANLWYGISMNQPDIDMTKHYLHVQESIRQAAIEKFSEAFMVEEDQMQNSSHLVLIKSS